METDERQIAVKGNTCSADFRTTEYGCVIYTAAINVGKSANRDTGFRLKFKKKLA